MELFSLNLPSVSIGKWMDHNSESIHGTTYGPVQGLSSVRTTAKGRDVFVHVFDWPAAALELTAENLPKFSSASLLATGQSLEFHQEGRHLTLKLPAQAPDPDVSVIAMRAAV